MRRLWRSRKALSPVVAAIILIAVTVAVSIAVAAWMGALTFMWMRSEALEVTSHEWVKTGGNVTGVKLYVKNTGSASLTLEYAEVNAERMGSVTFSDADMEPGDPCTVTITHAFSSGIAYNLAVITTTGTRAPWTATAPS